MISTANCMQQMTKEINCISIIILDEFLSQEILRNKYIDIIYEMFSKYLIDEDKEMYKKSIDLLKNNL